MNEKELMEKKEQLEQSFNALKEELERARKGLEEFQVRRIYDAIKDVGYNDLNDLNDDLHYYDLYL